jgi:hypothetical protein
MKREERRPAGVEDGPVVGDEDVDAVDVAAAGGDALGQLGDDADGVGALEEMNAEEVARGHGGGERPARQRRQHLPVFLSAGDGTIPIPIPSADEMR